MDIVYLMIVFIIIGAVVLAAEILWLQSIIHMDEQETEMEIGNPEPDIIATLLNKK